MRSMSTAPENTPCLLFFDGRHYTGLGEYLEGVAVVTGIKPSNGLGWEIFHHSSAGCGCCCYDPKDEEFLGWEPMI